MEYSDILEQVLKELNYANFELDTLVVVDGITKITLTNGTLIELLFNKNNKTWGLRYKRIIYNNIENLIHDIKKNYKKR